MIIDFVTRGELLPQCEAAIRLERAKLRSGATLRLTLAREKTGYSGQIIVIILPGAEQFWADWDANDVTRFPARIRAAATALSKCQIYGRFQITHENGALEIKPA
jgi:hypothetical protein